ncbi:MAG: tripartite tricarboxylate transporter substrate binding protein [Burkholderiales bacterium]|nr:tripartite tricarboxylate transporter substrate binding protein [Burkholderiales bacterium]MBZ0248810.1 tripartite tricarboxylate transporter substrate binding protein [Burkholderiales bacterium]MCL4687900.1 tripartite tricarboxylate transporter substrate binding protein [Burkholderiales bacterium]
MIKKLLMTLALSLGLAANAAADAYPSRAIKVIVPFPAGQASDTIARLVGEQLGRALGQAVVVENRPGAGGNIGSEAGARSAPDGYTLTMATAALPISKNVYKKLPFDPARDFEPVSLMTVTPLVLIARPSLPANDVASLVDLARKQPGKLTFASSGQGTSHHLSGELLKAVAGVDILHVPYKGSAPAHVDLMGGSVDIMFDNILPVSPHVKSGKLKALAVTTKSRAPSMPDVPTMAESGYPNFEAVAWFGLLAPAGTPAPIVERLSAEVNRILKSPEINARLTGMGANVMGTTPQEFSAFMKAEIEKWAPVVKRANIVLD